MQAMEPDEDTLAADMPGPEDSDDLLSGESETGTDDTTTDESTEE